MRADDGHALEAEHERGQREVLDGVPEGGRAEVEQSVQRVEAGVVVDGRIDRLVEPAQRNDRDDQVEQDQHQQREPEQRQAGADHGEHPGQVVGDLVVPRACEGTEADAERDRDDRAEGGQFHRRDEAARQHLGDGCHRDARPTQVAAQHAPDPVQVLHRQRVVQAVALLQGSDLAGRHLVLDVDRDR